MSRTFRRNRYASGQAGFTLVELAIVLVIIGLLIGGVLRGQEIMMTARMNSVIKQATSYAGALVTFQDTYSAKPGDFRSATVRLPNCAGSCVNGDGNGIIAEAMPLWTQAAQEIESENTQFWKHLSLARLISGINPTANTPQWGESHPVAAIGGFSVVTALGDGTATDIPNGSLALRLYGSLTSESGMLSLAAPSLSPKQASFIDRKMDDGVPTAGSVRTKGQDTYPGCEVQYTAEESTLCILAILLN